MTEQPSGRPKSKVARLIEEYGLEGIGDELESKWTGDDGDRMSLRALADFFNKRLLERALVTAGQSPVGTNIDEMYRNLVDEDTSSGVQTNTRKRLERGGVDVDALESDFLTYQAIRSYLKEWRNAEYEQISDTEKIHKDIEAIQRLQTRLSSVTEDRIRKLRDTDRIDAAEFDVLLDVTVLCDRCGTQYQASEFLERRGCDCQKK